MIDLNSNWLRKDTATPSVYYGYSNVANPSESDGVWAIRKVTATGATNSETWANNSPTFISKWSERASAFGTPSTIGISSSYTSDSLTIYWNRVPGVDTYTLKISEGGVVYNYLGYPDQNIHRSSPITVSLAADSGSTQSYTYKYSTPGKTYSVTIVGTNMFGSTSSSAYARTYPEPVPPIDPVFDGVTHAWPLNETDGTKMRQESLGSGADFFPQNVTTVNGQTKFSGGTNSYMSAPDIGLSLSTNQAFTWCFTIKPSSLTGSFELMCKGEGIFAAESEYRVYLSNATLNFRVYYDPSLSLTVADTLTNNVENIVFLVCDPANNSISIKINNRATVTANYTGTPTNRSRGMFGSLMLGNTAGYPFYSNVTTYASPTLPGIYTTSTNSAMSRLMFWKGTALTSTQITTVRTILTTTGFPWSTLPEVEYTLDPDTLPSSAKKRRFDFTNLSTQFQDAAGTVAVVSDNHPIRRINCLWNVNENAISNSDGVRPITRLNTLNGRPTAYSNGVDTQMLMSSPLQTTEGDFALFIVAKNDANQSAVSGPARTASHWLSHVTNGGVYVAHVGYNNVGYIRGYLASHKTQQIVPEGPVNSRGSIYPDNFTMLELQSISQGWNAFAGGYGPLNSSRNVANVNYAEFNTFFVRAASKTANEWAIGNIAEVIMLEGTFTATERARIRKFLDLKHNIVSAYAGY